MNTENQDFEKPVFNQNEKNPLLHHTMYFSAAGQKSTRKIRILVLNMWDI